MKTKTYHYQRTIRSYASTRAELCDIMQLDEISYNMQEFETGIALLEHFFDETPEGRKYARQISYNWVYWRWFRNLRAQMETTFWNQYRLIYCDNLQDNGSDRATADLRSEWQLEHNALLHSDAAHERLRNHIIHDLPQLEL